MGVMWRRLRGRVGHRGAFLLFLALLDFGIGYSLIGAETDHTSNVAGSTFSRLAAFNTLLPLDAWAGLWLGVGLVCLAGAFLPHDRVAYASASFIKTAWAAMYADLTWFQHYHRGFVAVLVWLAFAATTLMVSSWPEGGNTVYGAGRRPDKYGGRGDR